MARQILAQNLTTWAIGFSIRFYPVRFCNGIGLCKKTDFFFQIESNNLKLEIGSRKNQPYFDVKMWRYRWYRVDRTYRSIQYRYRYNIDTGTDPVPTSITVPVPYRCLTELTKVSGTGIDVPNLPKRPVPVLMYRSYRSVGAGIDVVPNLPKCPLPVLMLYRTYRSVRYRYLCRTELTEVSGTGMKVCTGTGDTGIHIVRNLPKCPVPVLMSYRS